MKAYTDPQSGRAGAGMILWLIVAVTDWTVMAAALFAAHHWPNPVVIFGAIFVLGNRQHALGVLGHDGAHYSITRTRSLNDLLTQVFVAWPLGLSLSGYRAFHLTHHRAIAAPGKLFDPEERHRLRFLQRHYPAEGEPRKLMLFFTDLCGATSISEFISLARREIFPHTTVAEKTGLALFWAAVLMIAWRFHALPLIAIWFTALLTSFWAFARLRMWREHFGVIGTNDTPVPWWGFLFHLPHNIGEHAEHHAHPARPFYELGRQ